MHGGASPRGAAHPSFRTGEHSAHVPAGLLNRFRRLQTDPALQDLTDEIALTTIHLQDALVAAVEYGAPAEMWAEARDLLADVLEARRGGNVDAETAALRALESLLLHGKAQAEAWSTFNRGAERKARLVTAETKRRTALDRGLSPEAVMTMQAMQLDAIRATFERFNVPREAYADLSARFAGLLARPEPGKA